MLVLLDRVAGEKRVQRWESRQGARHGQQHQIVDRDAAHPHLLRALLEPLAQRLHGPRIGGAVERQLRRRLQGLKHALGDHLAHTLDGDGDDVICGCNRGLRGFVGCGAAGNASVPRRGRCPL